MDAGETTRMYNEVVMAPWLARLAKTAPDIGNQGRELHHAVLEL
jgi:hypothetical protein